MVYAGLVLACSIPVYYYAISLLWQYELDEHNIMLTPEASREDSYLIIGAVTLLTLLFFIMLLLGFILLNRRVSTRLWKPFYESLQKIRDFNLDQNGTIEFTPTDIDEFSELNASLQKLIEGNVAAYKQQKEFADNASHELQTPLSITQSKLELLLQSPALTAKQYNLIEDALQALARVGRINKNLLLLTKIENSQFMTKEKISISDLIESSISLFTKFSDSRHIELQSNILNGISVEGNKILVEILLHNLLTNGIRHSNSCSVVSISLSQTTLEIKNPGITPLDTSQLYKRFGTTSTNTPGTGLGLALVKQICLRYHWQVHYQFESGLHSFSIHF